MYKHTRKQLPTTNTPKDSTNSKSKDYDVLKIPIQSGRDKKEYKVIRLKNGLTACLISDTSKIQKEQNLASDTIDSEYSDPSDSEYSDTSNSEYSDTNNSEYSHTSDSEYSDSSNSENETESEYESESQTSDSELEIGDHDDSKMKRVLPSEEKMAAVALSIGVGSFSDPPDIPGLANFVEHMVVMGSEKYPQKNDFDAFIRKRGGSYNAYTDCEMTTFSFECLEKYLHQSLDKFAHFFIAPLIKKKSMTRERETIKSEYEMALPSDTHRIEQLLLSLFNPKVPINPFSWGNLKALRDVKSDDLYKKLHEFRKYHYSAHRMTFAIQARLPMKLLEKFTLECLGSIPSNNLPADDFKKYSNIIFDSSKFNKLFYVKPSKDIMQVDLTWSLPSLLHKYKSKPHDYILWLIGREDKGSLLSYLKKRVWALGISFGNDVSGSNQNSIYSLFTISINLTTEGVLHLDEVIASVYSYLRMLNKMGPQERIFKEIQLIRETSFKFTEKGVAVDLVEELTENMQVYPSKYYLTGSELYFEYDPKAIEMVMSHLRVENMNIMVLTTTLPAGIKYDRIEPCLNINYASQDIPNNWKNKWMGVPIYPDFSLPPPNPYITKNFSILPDSLTMPNYPQRVFKTDVFELWYKQDNKFKIPIAYYNFYFISPVIKESAMNASLTDMFVNLLHIQLSEELYPAAVAELNYEISIGDRGIIIKVNGYNENLPILLNVILKYFKKVSQNLTVEMFDSVKDKLQKLYHNKLLKPSNLTKELRLSILLDHYWTIVDKHTAMFTINYDIMKKFCDKLINSFYILGLAQGNISKETAIMTSKMLLDVVNCEPLLPRNFPKIRVHELPIGEQCCRAMSFNENDSKSIITNYYQSQSFSMKTNVILELLIMYMEEPLLDILGTKEQLDAYCAVQDTFGVLGYSISVTAQAGNHTTDFVDGRIEAFTKHINKLLKKLTEKKLNEEKRYLIEVTRCDDVDLEEEVSRNWTEVVNQDFMFDRQEREVLAIEELKLADIKTFWEDHNIFGNKNNFKKLSVQVVGYNVDMNKPNSERSSKRNVKMSPKMLRKNRGNGKEKSQFEDDSGRTHSPKFVGILNKSEKRSGKYFIKNIQEFKKKLSLYPDVKRNELSV